jgi:hypothetical protein
VSSLGESMMQEAAALSLHDPQQHETDQQQPLLQHDAAATGAVASQTTADLVATPAATVLQGPEAAHAAAVQLPAGTGPEGGAARRLPRPLPVLRVVGGKEGGMGRRHSVSTAADTTGGHSSMASPLCLHCAAACKLCCTFNRCSLLVLQGLIVAASLSANHRLAARLTHQMPPLLSTTQVRVGGGWWHLGRGEKGSSRERAKAPLAGKLILRPLCVLPADPFSFPVTPPSEAAPPPDPAPLFGSWASLKSSPDRKVGQSRCAWCLLAMRSALSVF